MKKIASKTGRAPKLELKKETLTVLSQVQLIAVNGGSSNNSQCEECTSLKLITPTA